MVCHDATRKKAGLGLRGVPNVKARRVPEPRERGTSGMESSNRRRRRLHYFQVLSRMEAFNGQSSMKDGGEKRSEASSTLQTAVLFCLLLGKRLRGKKILGLTGSHPPFSSLPPLCSKYDRPRCHGGPAAGRLRANELAMNRGSTGLGKSISCGNLQGMTKVRSYLHLTEKGLLVGVS